MSIRDRKEASRDAYEAFKASKTEEADRLRAAGFVFRGTGQKSFDSFFARWMPRTDYWSPPIKMEGVEHGIWLERLQALALI